MLKSTPYHARRDSTNGFIYSHRRFIKTLDSGNTCLYDNGYHCCFYCDEKMILKSYDEGDICTETFYDKSEYEKKKQVYFNYFIKNKQKTFY